MTFAARLMTSLVWQRFSGDHAYMHFADAPYLSHRFMPGMFELHEQVMCRRRASDAQSWNWRTGSTAPVLPVGGGC